MLLASPFAAAPTAGLLFASRPGRDFAARTASGLRAKRRSCLALTIERLYRLRYLPRGTHRVRTAIELLRLLRLSLAPPAPLDSS